MIEGLMNKGHRVKFVTRADGSARITEIDGIKYGASNGNAKAREILQQPLSVRRLNQARKNASKQKGKKRKKTNFEQTEQEKLLRRRVRRTQRIMRVALKDSPVTVSWKSVKYTWQKYGMEEALEKLGQAERYAKGLAYPINIQHFIDRLGHLNSVSGSRTRYYINKVIDYLERYKDSETITEDQLQKLIELYYDYTTGTLKIEDWYAHAMRALYQRQKTE